MGTVGKNGNHGEENVNCGKKWNRGNGQGLRSFN